MRRSIWLVTLGAAALAAAALAPMSPRASRDPDRPGLWIWHKVGANRADPCPNWCDLEGFDVDGVSCGNAIMKTNERKSNSTGRDGIE